jgi:DNA (cytosine-5)-methyltransferase 1
MIAVDLFAGAGGFTEGARIAGVHVAWAADHWKAAVKCHEANHPETEHSCQDLHQADWRVVPAHDILLASPPCQGFSKARGKDRPHHDTMRSTAWAVVSCAEYHRSAAVLVENVPDFRDWTLYPSWEDAMGRLGYAVAFHLVDAADHGVPQHRKRLFIVCTQSKAPLRLSLPKRPHTPIASVLDWDGGAWSPIDKPGRAAATLRRIEVGRAEFGSRFVAPYYGGGSGLQGRSIDRPIGTITTRDRWSVIDGDRMRMLSVPEACAAMGFRQDYILPKVKKSAMHMLGNAVCPPVAADLLRAIKGSDGAGAC